MTHHPFRNQRRGGLPVRSLLWPVILLTIAFAPAASAQSVTGADPSALAPAGAGGAASPANVPPPPDTSASPPSPPFTSATPEAGSEPPLVLPPPAGELTVIDAPNDAGQSLAVTWRPGLAPDGLTGYQLRAEQAQPLPGKAGESEPYVVLRSWPAGQEEYTAKIGGLIPNADVQVTVRGLAGETPGEAGPARTAVPKGNLFHTGKLPVGAAILCFVGLLTIYVRKSRSGKKLFVRKIAGLEAVEDAVGRATEMGRSILYVPGLSGISDVATIASLSILAPVARKAATYSTRLIVPNRDPIVFTVAREVVKTAYNQVGRPDLFDDNSVFFITDSQFGFAAAVDGIIVRERPATNFFLGMFWAESLVMAETGAATGAIQIAGTDAVNQIPFFIVSCDYTLIGEELYAASAYLGNEPILLGTLKAQDAIKLLLLFVILAGVVSSLAGSTLLFDLLRPPL